MVKKIMVTLREKIVRPPDTIFLMGLAAISGSAQLLDFRHNAPVAHLVPMWAYIFWALTLSIGSFVALIGVFWYSKPKGLLIEAAGRWMLWPSSVAYALALFLSNGYDLGAMFTFMFGITCLARILYIQRQFDEWKAYVRHGT